MSTSTLTETPTSQGVADTGHLLEALIDTSPVIVYTKDLEGRFTYVSAHFEEMSGTKRREFRGQTVFDLFSQEEAEFFTLNDQLALASSNAIEVRENVKTPDGARVFHSVNFVLRDESGEAFALCGMSLDITERAQREDGAQAREDASQVRADASHVREDESQARENASHVREDESQAREDASHVREGESQAREDASQVRADESQAREDASQVRADESQAREDASQVRADESQAREDASHVREAKSEAREKDTAEVHENMREIIDGVLGAQDAS